MKTLIFYMLSIATLSGGTLRVDISHRFDDLPATLNSLKYKAKETISISRLSYLISQPSLQREDNTWYELPEQFAWIDLSSRRTSFTLTDVPSGSYKALRFSIGVPSETNHKDPSNHPANHPLNPNLNNLHWTWSGSYIFLALEGYYRALEKETKGFVFHLANDQNFSRIQLAANFNMETKTAINLSFNLKKLLTQPRPISFQKDGNSTHSKEGDPIASALVANLQSTFSVLGIFYPPTEVPREKITPLYIPDKYTPYPFKMSRSFPMPLLPRDNPLLIERVELGKYLFHDKSLSANGTVSCASCHDSAKAFTDGLPVSTGINGKTGDRNSMPLFNLAWKSSFFWDGRSKSLRDQVLQPIQDHREMASDLSTVVEHLEKTQRLKFEKAFGPGPVNEEKIALALENLLLTLTSYVSKFDRAVSGKETLTTKEQRGMELFFTEYEPRSGQLGADCFHCHGGANFSDHQLHDNGLGEGIFATPSLRNLTLTAPYMHDGRFKTLEEVVAHYSGPMKRNKTLDPNLSKHPRLGLQLSSEDQAALVAFLKTLTDPKYLETQN